MVGVSSPFVSVALLRLRRGVNACCWIAGAALVAQLLVWCVATFTEVRAQNAAESPTNVVITSADQPKAVAATVAGGRTAIISPAAESTKKQIAPTQRNGRFDPALAMLSSLALASGTLATMILILLLGMGVMLGVSSATSGVDEAVAAFMWGAVFIALALPWGDAFGLPWREGAFMSYSVLTYQVDLELANSAWGGPVFYARCLVLPLACVAMLVVVAMRFNNGVHAGTVAGEAMRLDPTLERETAAIKPGSLHGGRAGRAISTAINQALAHDGPITQANPGKLPRRLI